MRGRAGIVGSRQSRSRRSQKHILSMYLPPIPLPKFDSIVPPRPPSYRAEKGLNPLRLDPALTAMAERQAQAMAQSGTMSHDVAGSLSARLAASGINAPAGENLGEGYMSFEQALAGWRASVAPDLATSTLGLSWPMVGGIGLFVVNYYFMSRRCVTYLSRSPIPFR